MVHLVTAVIRPLKIDDVVLELREVGIEGMTITNVCGFGHEGGLSETYRGSEYHRDYVPKVKLEILCDTFQAERIARLIATTAATGRRGDGRVWISEVASVIHIRSDVSPTAPSGAPA